MFAHFYLILQTSIGKRFEDRQLYFSYAGPYTAGDWHYGRSDDNQYADYEPLQHS